MTLQKLILELRHRGVTLTAAGEALRGEAPKGAITPELREALAAHKAELLALLRLGNLEVAWRVEAMRPQVPSTGAIPFLMARDAPSRQGCCSSCGDPLSEGQHSRCGACARAAAIVVWGRDPGSADRRQEGGSGE